MARSYPSTSYQEFKGERYYLCGDYYQRNGVRLHRVVWMDAHGVDEIPSGFEVHHRDKDRTNNSPDNLELLSIQDHKAKHPPALGRKPSPRAIEGCRAWHRSPAGIAWHHDHYRRTSHMFLHQQMDGKCEQCGRAYSRVKNGRNQFCSPSCVGAHRRATGVDNEARTCPICNSTFTINRYSRTQTCGRVCAAALRRRNAGA